MLALFLTVVLGYVVIELGGAVAGPHIRRAFPKTLFLLEMAVTFGVASIAAKFDVIGYSDPETGDKLDGADFWLVLLGISVLYLVAAVILWAIEFHTGARRDGGAARRGARQIAFVQDNETRWIAQRRLNWSLGGYLLVVGLAELFRVTTDRRDGYWAPLLLYLALIVLLLNYGRKGVRLLLQGLMALSIGMNGYHLLIRQITPSDYPQVALVVYTLIVLVWHNCDPLLRAYFRSLDTANGSRI